MLAARRISLALPALLLACRPQVEIDTDTEGTGSTTDSTTTAITTDPTVDPTVDPDDGTDGPVPTVRAVDLLFVVDNSGSMGEEQEKLARSMGTLVALLDATEPPIDYRIGVTTTDNGNPWCGTTTPEAGSLRATSCRSRLSEFVFEGATTIDVSLETCEYVCTVESLEITDGKPWIDVQRSTGSSNVSGNVAANVTCMLPQGIDGCGFESPLESMRKTILRSEEAAEDEYGFHREGALLAVAIVTDEEDCSYDNEWESIFLPDGNRVFWSDPTAGSPTSAVCWHAGVACSGSGNPYDECHAVDLDVDGNQTASPDDEAVLRPLSRYVEQLAAAGAYVLAIDGVTADGSVVYATGMDDVLLNDYGIAPGCQSEDGLAVPPVRIREMIDAVSGPGQASSICAAAYDDAMDMLVQGIIDRLP